MTHSRTAPRGCGCRRRPVCADAAGFGRLSLLLAGAALGLATLPARPLVSQLFPASPGLPACGSVVNRWANDRLQVARERYAQEHQQFRSLGQAGNAVTAALAWIDDRLIDHNLEGERREVRAIAHRSASCDPRFEI